MESIPVYDAALQNDVEEVKRLVQEDPGVVNIVDNYTGQTALMIASRHGHVEVVSYLLDHGADINITDASLINYFGDQHGVAALHHACANGHLRVVELLVSRGANPILNRGSTPLIEAAGNNHLAVVEYLLGIRAVRANLDAQHTDSYTALSMATQFRHLEVMKALVKAGADFLMPDRNFDIPMDIAQEVQDHELIKLIEVGVVAFTTNGGY